MVRHKQNPPSSSAPSTKGRGRVGEFIEQDRQARFSLIAAHALTFSVSLSVFAHVLFVFGVTFVMPQIKLGQRTQTLDMVLVNAKTTQAPKNAKVLAQANMDGGGNVDEKMQPKSPLPPEDADQNSDSVLEAAQRRVREEENRSREMLTQLKKNEKVVKNLTTKTAKTPNTETEKTAGEDTIDLQAIRAMAAQRAIVNENEQRYAERPKKVFVGASAKEHYEAAYAEGWRQKIERIGVLNYPSDPQKGRLRGSLIVLVEIRADGTVAKAEIEKSSGNKAIDDAALRIVHLSAPFSSFPPELKKKADIISMHRRWTFESDRLSTQ